MEEPERRPRPAELPVTFRTVTHAERPVSAWRVLLGGGIACFFVLLFFASVGLALWMLGGEIAPRVRNNREDLFAIPVQAMATLVVGIGIRRGLRTASSSAGFPHPFLARAALWLCVILSVGCAARALLFVVERGPGDHGRMVLIAGATVLLLAVGVLQFVILMRSPLLARSGDLEDGAIL